jgi:hypothetical protein
MERDPSTAVIADESQSAVSWGAILAGAVAAVALSFVLMGLAAGFGLKLASPWPGARPSLAGFTPILGAWMMVVQVLSSALGGYLAGRLRTKWLNVHAHEVHFRDTAHGLLVWAVTTLAGVVLVATLLAPPPEVVAAAVVGDPALLQLAAERQANIAAQFSLFMAVGLLLGAFVASVAAAIGGLRRDEMHTMFRDQRGRVERPAPL